MAKFSVAIETDLIGPQYLSGEQRVTASTNQVGLLSSITLLNPDGSSTALLQQFDVGLNGAPRGRPSDKIGYVPGNIITAKDGIRASCQVIATVGGSVMLQALQAEPKQKMPSFVSLVGEVPPGGLAGSCKGGVSLESIALNAARKNYLKSLGGAYTDATICLYANYNSEMHADEVNAWGGGNPVYLSNVAQPNNVNNANNCTQDFNGGGVRAQIPGNINALVISDDPFFQDNQPTLVPLIDTWLGGGAGIRRVVYPNQNWPLASIVLINHAGKGFVIGPNLMQAYMILGAMAGILLKNNTTTLNFVRLGPDPTVLL